jgi:hypothetical protein
METCEIGGRTYYWDGRYFARHKGLDRAVRAHVEVWTERFGPVPEGYELHHFDRDRRNNDVSNLIVLTTAAHKAMHANDPGVVEHMRRVQPLGQEAAKAWHKSEEGKQRHKEQFLAQMEKIGTKTCNECGAEFTPANFRQRFCVSRCCNRFKRREWRKRQATKCGAL